MKKGFQFKEADDGDKDQTVRNYSWSKMLAKVFKIDVTKCQSCGGDLARAGAIMSQESIKRYLSHIGRLVQSKATALRSYLPRSSVYEARTSALPFS